MQCILQLNGTENKKCSPWTSPLKHFGTGEALEAQTWDCLNITLAQKWHSAFFKFLQEKGFLAWQQICRHHKARTLHSFNMCRKFLLSSLEPFFCRNLKNVGMSFLANMMLRQSRIGASRASPAQKLQGLRVITLDSGIDVGQGITVGPGKLFKKNKHRALNKHRAWTKCPNLCYKNPIKLENICRPWGKFQNLINLGPLIRL